MNERIREVWLKAARADSDPDNWDTQEQFIEKFAELIVRECARVVSEKIGPKSALDVLEHFGVEQ